MYELCLTCRFDEAIAAHASEVDVFSEEIERLQASLLESGKKDVAPQGSRAAALLRTKEDGITCYVILLYCTT